MKGMIITIWAALTFVVLRCDPSPSAAVSVLDAERFEQMLGEDDDKIVVDVRTPEEFAEGHIPGAVLINAYDADFGDKIKKLDKSRTVYVYCASGLRSKKASAILKESGFEQVYHLKDGLKAWNKAGKALTRSGVNH